MRIALRTAAGFAALMIVLAPGAPAQTPPQTAAFCQATWRFPDGLRTFSGAGRSEAEALASASAKCRAKAPDDAIAACAGDPLISCGVTARGTPSAEAK
jgi:hypothetical protein